MKKLNKIVNIVMLVTVALYALRVVCVVLNFIFRPEIYGMQSAPWYTSIIVDGFFAAILLLICAIFKLIIFIKNKRTEKS